MASGFFLMDSFSLAKFHLLAKTARFADRKWSMVNACTPQGEPILGTGGEKKNYIMYIVLDRLSSPLAEIVRLIKNCNPMLVEFRLLQP